MTEPPYTREILRLAASIPYLEPFDELEGATELRSKTCGSRMRVAVELEVPAMWSFAMGVVVPMPTLPPERIVILSTPWAVGPSPDVLLVTNERRVGTTPCDTGPSTVNPKAPDCT